MEYSLFEGVTVNCIQYLIKTASDRYSDIYCLQSIKRKATAGDYITLKICMSEFEQVARKSCEK